MKLLSLFFLLFSSYFESNAFCMFYVSRAVDQGWVILGSLTEKGKFAVLEGGFERSENFSEDKTLQKLLEELGDSWVRHWESGSVRFNMNRAASSISSRFEFGLGLLELWIEENNRFQISRTEQGYSCQLLNGNTEISKVVGSSFEDAVIQISPILEDLLEKLVIGHEL